MRVNEIFYSIQGEGYHAGRAAIFIRLSGCNLKCPFCDTNHTNGKEMSDDEIISEINKYKCNFVVITGGEPGIQLTESFIDRLHKELYYVAVETNGTYILPDNIDWITVSPKSPYINNAEINQERINELKLVYDGEIKTDPFLNIISLKYYLQPCDTGDDKKNEFILNETIKRIQENPKWRLSLQTQKIINVK